MRAMRRREARDETAKISLSYPFRQTALQHALAAAANTGDDDYSAISTRLGRAQKARERGPTCFLSMPMKIELAADLELTAPDAFLVAAILWQWRRLRSQGGCSGLWRRCDTAPMGARFVGFFRIVRQWTACLYARGNAAPQLLLIGSKVALSFAHAA